MILRRKGFDSNGNESVDKEYVREMDHSGVNERRRLTMMIGAKQNRSEREGRERGVMGGASASASASEG